MTIFRIKVLEEKNRGKRIQKEKKEKNPKNRKRKNPKKNRKGKIQKKIEKGKIQKKIEKEKVQKKNPKEKKSKKNLFSVVLDKICVFCLYPIPDSQQCVKRGSCRRQILSGLLCLFLFWVSYPF